MKRAAMNNDYMMTVLKAFCQAWLRYSYLSEKLDSWKPPLLGVWGQKKITNHLGLL
jgi:hypothetical protein